MLIVEFSGRGRECGRYDQKVGFHCCTSCTMRSL
jgi:hypothetical protein